MNSPKHLQRPASHEARERENISSFKSGRKKKIYIYIMVIVNSYGWHNDFLLVSFQEPDAFTEIYIHSKMYTPFSCHQPKNSHTVIFKLDVDGGVLRVLKLIAAGVTLLKMLVIWLCLASVQKSRFKFL